MVSSINGSDDSIQALMMQMMQNMSAADTDGTTGLSADELSSIDAGSDVGGSAFLQSLTDQFETLDADGNGQLTSDEISNAVPSEPMGPPPGMDLSSSDSITDLFDSLLDSLTESLDSDDSGSLSTSELVAADESDTAGSGVIDDLISNFDSYDTNSDGELSEDEMKQAIVDNLANKVAQVSESTTSSAENSASELGESLGNMASSFFDKLISNYQKSGLSSLVSSISVST